MLAIGRGKDGSTQIPLVRSCGRNLGRLAQQVQEQFGRPGILSPLIPQRGPKPPLPVRETIVEIDRTWDHPPAVCRASVAQLLETIVFPGFPGVIHRRICRQPAGCYIPTLGVSPSANLNGYVTSITAELCPIRCA